MVQVPRFRDAQPVRPDRIHRCRTTAPPASRLADDCPRAPAASLPTERRVLSRHLRVYAWCMRGLTDTERRTIRSALVAELGRTEEQTASLARQFDDIVAAAEMSNIDDEHDPEGTTIAFERAQVSALHRQAVRDAAALRRTLTDVDDDEFGACEQCGRPIGFERLVALPATRCCVECAR